MKWFYSILAEHVKFLYSEDEEKFQMFQQTYCILLYGTLRLNIVPLSEGHGVNFTEAHFLQHKKIKMLRLVKR